MEINRRKNAFLGTLWGFIQRVISIIFPFIIRTIFIKKLGAQYLGLNGLFSSILNVLNLAELGFSSALVFSMYKPIVDDDNNKICALMNLYKTCYRIIGFIVLLLGGLLTPFIPKLISGTMLDEINIYIIYLMNLGATVLSYWLFAYCISLFEAHQRVDIINIIKSIILVITYIVQLITLVVFRNYYLYLLINIASQIFFNLIIAYSSKKHYPKYKPCGNVQKEERKEIFKKVCDLFTAKIGGIFNNSADQIVISAFLGLEILAVYQNYYFIISTVLSFFYLFFNACHAGIANYLITNKSEENSKLLYNINYIAFFGLNFCCVSIMCLTQPFITLWLGQDFLLSISFLIFFVLYFSAEIIPRTLILFKDAAGLWHKDRFRPLIVSFVNLFLNVLVVKHFGLIGVTLSTIIAMLFVGFPWLLVNIDRNLFKIDIKKFLFSILKYIIVIIVNCFITYKIIEILNIHNLLYNLFVSTLLCLIIPNTMFLVLFYKTEENQYLLNIIKERKEFKVLRRIKNKYNTFIHGTKEDIIMKNYYKRFSQYSFHDGNCKTYEQYEASITRAYHTIENGLAYLEYRVCFGRDMVELLINEMKTYSKTYDINKFFYKTALSVLNSYVEKNAKYGKNDEELRNRILQLPGTPNEMGGTIIFEEKDMSKANWQELIEYRHSIRHFSTETNVDSQTLNSAILLAQNTPSACNRQGWRTYIIQNKKTIADVLMNQNGNRGFGHEFNKLLLVVGDLQSFNNDREVFQLFIDGGMYAMRLLDALCYKGIGSVPLSASLTPEQDENIRKILKMNESEIPIMLIGIGNYPDICQTTKSTRHEPYTVVI